jgi:serpin B
MAALGKEMKTAYVVICLPRFETNVKTNLLDAFEQLKLPFNCNDLRGMVLSNGEPRGLSVSDAFQCARIRVDEKGTEAGAVTVINFTDGMPINQKVFNADHPFVYLLTEEQTGTILFVGTYHGK